MYQPILAGWQIPTMLGFGMPGGAEWIVIAAFGLLIFGKRLPEVGRGLGRSIIEFKKGLKGVEDDIEEQTNQPSRPASQNQFDPYTGKPLNTLPQGYKFDPHTGKPIDQAATADTQAASEKVG